MSTFRSSPKSLSSFGADRFSLGEAFALDVFGFPDFLRDFFAVFDSF